MDEFDGGIAVAGDINCVSGAFETPRKKILNSFLVLNDQYSHRFR